MNIVQQKIYDYFERDPELKVLFIFNNENLWAFIPLDGSACG